MKKKKEKDCYHKRTGNFKHTTLMKNSWSKHKNHQVAPFLSTWGLAAFSTSCLRYLDRTGSQLAEAIWWKNRFLVKWRKYRGLVPSSCKRWLKYIAILLQNYEIVPELPDTGTIKHTTRKPKKRYISPFISYFRFAVVKVNASANADGLEKLVIKNKMAAL